MAIAELVPVRLSDSVAWARMRNIYLDYASTTPLSPVVQEAMIPFLAEFHGAPAGSHWLARASAEALEDARGRVASLLGAQRDEIVFTSGSIESINLALKGTVLRRRPFDAQLILTEVDQPSVLAVAQFLETWGCGLTILPVTSQGLVTAAALEAAITPETVLVSLPHVVPETGVVQPAVELGEVCRQKNVLLHLDATYSAGQIAVDARTTGADLISISGHRLYAPKGTGALYVRHGLPLEPLLHGVGHEAGLRAGLQHVAGLVGLGRAAQMVRDSLETLSERLARLRDRLYNGLRAAIGETLPLYGDQAERVAGTLAVGFPRCLAEELLARTPEICAQPLAMSPALQAMGIAAGECRSAIRFSVGWYSTEEEIDHAISLLASAWESLQA
jgi:cysteine desulfurase